MLQPPFPDLDDLLKMMGEAGRHLTEMGATEGAAGNISVCMRWPVDPRGRFPVIDEIELPEAVPELAGSSFLVTGSGRRLRELLDEPTASIAFLTVNTGGKTARLYTAYQRRFEKLTSEFNSHLAVHRDQIHMSGSNFHAVVHAQPVHLTYLSHIPRFQDEKLLNGNLLRWQPETIVNLPEGIAVVPFQLPGSRELMAETVQGLRRCRIVLWVKHGVMARSDVSVKRAADRVEYAEVAAKYEYLDLCNDQAGERLSVQQIRGICQAFNVQQSIF
ncbi:MAG TPA: class II aldolase/adducin family protein [Anaerolineales bacterium]|nr:class II aldolase/adducin family protein [Anaerolineales bacterium]